MYLFYIKGSTEFFDVLGDIETTDDLSNAQCAVVEIPGSIDSLKQLPNIPIVVVITSMLTYKDWKTIQKHEITYIENVQSKLEDYTLKTQPKDETDMFFDPPEEEQVQTQPQSKKTQLISESENMEIEEKSITEETIPPRNTSTTLKPRQRNHDIFERSNNNRAHIIASFSASGGVGKTFSTINIGGSAALEGISSVAVDLDFGFGDIDTAIGLVDPSKRDKIIDKKGFAPKTGWATVAQWRQYARNLKGNLLRHNSGMYILPCYPHVGYDTIPDTEIEDLILTLAEQFDLITIDLGVDAFSPHARTALKIADTVFLVGGQDEKTIGKLTQFLGTKESHIEKMRLIINMVTPTGYYAPKEIAKKLNFNTFDEIPMDQQGVNAANKARKLTIQLNGSAAGEAVKKIAGKHLPFHQLSVNQIEKQKKNLFSGVKSILRRN